MGADSELLSVVLVLVLLAAATAGALYAPRGVGVTACLVGGGTTRLDMIIMIILSSISAYSYRPYTPVGTSRGRTFLEPPR